MKHKNYQTWNDPLILIFYHQIIKNNNIEKLVGVSFYSQILLFKFLKTRFFLFSSLLNFLNFISENVEQIKGVFFLLQTEKQKPCLGLSERGCFSSGRI